ncbi:hypothetical protein [Amycolatopsis palatopharyngis]|uniref:hypothetical protein n=1 Tax=Amycolatopsis palatopharyngis TaxID=187982 RepID=UPI000E2282D3|nr:hypothetical protein [Amycolatopsis palatopharyngis]
MRVANAQLPPIQDSDDKIFTTPHAVIMLDGASAFVPVPVPANTYADRLGKHLRDSLQAWPDADLRATLAGAWPWHRDLAPVRHRYRAPPIGRIPARGVRVGGSS